MADKKKQDLEQENQQPLQNVEMQEMDTKSNDAKAEENSATTPVPYALDGEFTLAPPNPKKKKKRKNLLLIGVGVVAVGLIAFKFISDTLKGPDKVYVETQAAETGVIQQTIATTGKLVTGEKITVYSPVTAPLTEVGVELGRPVTAGSQIFNFDTKELERLYRSSSAGSGLAGLQKQDAYKTSNENQKDANDTQASINSLREQRDAAKRIIAENAPQLAAWEAANAAALTAAQKG